LLTSVADGRLVRHQLPHTTVWLDREAQAIVGSVSSADDLSLYERGKPLHYLLSLWHNDRGTFVTHGALVARGDAGVLLAGAGGSGKSTTTAACSSADFACVGDYCIGLERRPDGTFAGHGLFASIWLDDDALSRLPRFADGAVSGARPGEDRCSSTRSGRARAGSRERRRSSPSDYLAWSMRRRRARVPPPEPTRFERSRRARCCSSRRAQAWTAFATFARSSRACPRSGSISAGT
jgi:hypothetical protein